MEEQSRTYILEASDLSVSFETDAGEVQAVRDVSLSLKEGEVLAIVGESGCGKSVLCKSLMKMLPGNARIKSGKILANGIDITGYKERDMAKLRGTLFSMVFQDPMTALNPTMTIGRQIEEAIKIHNPHIKRDALEKRVIELMGLVGIDQADERRNLYPYHFSGGMRQRSVLAIALAGNPSILIADEPTTALDVTIQAQILDLFRDIQKKMHTSTIFVTHDLGVVARVADRVAVMYAGKIVELGTTEDIFYDARHPYTWGLMQALPAYAKGKEMLHVIPGMPPVLIDPPRGDAFACRNEYALAIDYEKEPPMFRISDTHYAATWLLDERAPEIKPPSPVCSSFFAEGYQREGCEETAERKKTSVVEECQNDAENRETLVAVNHLTKSFSIGKRNVHKAVDDVSFRIYKGEVFGLVGESGSGKSTIGRSIIRLYDPTAGEINFNGMDISGRINKANSQALRTQMQMIFQDPMASLNPRKKVRDIIGEGLDIHHMYKTRAEREEKIKNILAKVGLAPEHAGRYPHQFSGGQRQRVGIARALIMNPKMIIADECISALDVSIQAQVVNLMKDIQQETGTAYLFIAHDLSMVKYISDRIGVLH
ncbi:MAG: ABC transporter ATP-binding protein, partial [Roseburia inulinivorans]|nr:ABC transporter ATP-binding protein [Roseburia inulinivorans]